MLHSSDLPYPLGQLWDYLAWVDMSWLLCRAWQTVGMLGLAHIALSIWRNVQKKTEMGKQSKPVTQEGMGLWGAGKAWPYHFQG